MILKCQKFLGFHLTNRAKKPLRGASSQLGIPYAPDAEGRVDVCVTQSIAHHLRPSEPSGITKSIATANPSHNNILFYILSKYSTKKNISELPSNGDRLF